MYLLLNLSNNYTEKYYYLFVIFAAFSFNNHNNFIQN